MLRRQFLAAALVVGLPLAPAFAQPPIVIKDTIQSIYKATGFDPSTL